MSQEDEAYALAHFGVKGMHWGVRKETDSGGTTRPNHEVAKAAGLAAGITLATLIATPLGILPAAAIGAGSVAAGKAYVAKHPQITEHSIQKGKSVLHR